MLFRHGDLEIHKNGWSVEGTIVGYEVNYYQRSPGYGGTYKCVFSCEYNDAKTDKRYHAITYYSVRNKVDSKEWCESKVGKPIELVIDKYGHCIAKRDMTFDLMQWIFLPRGIFIIVGIVGIIVIVVKKFYFDRRKQLATENIEEQKST